MMPPLRIVEIMIAQWPRASLRLRIVQCVSLLMQYGVLTEAEQKKVWKRLADADKRRRGEDQ